MSKLESFLSDSGVQSVVGFYAKKLSRCFPLTMEVEDAAQEIYTELLTNIKRYDPSRGSKATFTKWVSRTTFDHWVRNKTKRCHDWRRANFDYDYYIDPSTIQIEARVHCKIAIDQSEAKLKKEKRLQSLQVLKLLRQGCNQIAVSKILEVSESHVSRIVVNDLRKVVNNFAR